MKRKVYAYKLSLVGAKSEGIHTIDSFENDMNMVINYILSLTLIKRKHDIVSQSKILYLKTYKYDKLNQVHNFLFESAKYNSMRNVVDTDTLHNKGILKSKKDGDSEKNHICIKFIEENEAICLFEGNFYGIGLGSIITYLNDFIKDYHAKNDKDIKYFYKMKYEALVSYDFLKALEESSRIKMVTLTVDQEDLSVSEYKAASGRNDISQSVDIVFRPAARGKSIMGDTVKDFYKIYNKKDVRIKRICVDADRVDGEFSFNTEEIKSKGEINVKEDRLTGEVDTQSIFKAFSEKIYDYC